MDKKKLRSLLLIFVFCVALIIIYKSIDNISHITEYIGKLLRIIRPFFIGFVIAYILNSPCEKLSKLISKSKISYISKKSKGLGILATYLLAVLVIFIIVRAIVPAIYTNVLDLYNNAPLYITKFMRTVDFWQEKLGVSIFTNESELMFENKIRDYISGITISEFSKYAQGVVTVTSGLLNVFIAIIVSIYMIYDSQYILSGCKKIIERFAGDEKTLNMSKRLSEVNVIFSKYIYCRILDGVIMAVFTFIVLSILRVKYALALGVLIGFCDLIPYFGSIFGSIAAMIITLLSGGIYKMIWTGIALLIMQQIDGNLIGPKIMGEVLEIKPLAVIFAVTLGGGLFGVWGMILSVPVFVVLKMLLANQMNNKRVIIHETNAKTKEDSDAEEKK